MKKIIKKSACVFFAVALVFCFCVSSLSAEGERDGGKEAFVRNASSDAAPFSDPSSEPPQTARNKGDVNGDGFVDIVDAMLVCYHVARKELISEDFLDAADIDSDENVDISDVMLLLFSVAYGGESDHCHIFVEHLLAPTCSEEGLRTRKCELCGKENTQTLAPEPHSYGKVEETAPTCEEDGRIIEVCASCGKRVETVLPATGHTIRTETVAPTCEEDGRIIEVCASCGKRVETVLPATGHTIRTETVAPTCEEDGRIIEVCASCGKRVETVLPATGHTIRTETVAPTCEKDGEEVSTCSVCGFTVRRVLKARHSWEKTKTISEPTEKAEGKGVFVCSVCGKEEKRDIPRLRGKSGVFKYYTQWDGRWSSIKFGKYTMGRNGCAPTAIAMALNYRGISVTPKEVAEWLYDFTDEFCKTFSGSSGSAIRLAAEHYGAETLNIFEYEDLLSALENDGAVCIAVGKGIFCDHGTHCIFLYGYDRESGKVNAADPWTRKMNGVYDLAQIWSERSTAPVDLREDGCAAYGIR